MDTKEELRERRQAAKQSKRFAFLFPAVLFYYEITFRLFIGLGLFHLDTLLLIPLCCAYGGIGYLLCTISKNRRVNIYLTVALLFLAALPYCVEAFLFREFGILYNFSAIFAGAGNAVGNFGGEVVSLIFSFRGIFCIAVYLLPTVLFALFGSAPTRIRGHERGFAAARMAAFYLLSFAIIHIVPSFYNAYTVDFSFQSSTERLGLITGAQLETRREMFGGGATATFQQVDMRSLAGQTEQAADAGAAADPSASADPNATADPNAVADPNATADPNAPADPNAAVVSNAEPVDYGYNQLDLPLGEETSETTEVYRSLDLYVSGLTASKKNAYTGMFAGKNLIMITAEAFTKEAIDPERTPTLYRMLTKGVNFTDYYQFAGAGTTGGEFQHIFGLLPRNSLNSMLDMTSHNVLINMPSELYARGYYGAAFHNGTSTFYDRDRTHTRLGFSEGFFAFGCGLEDIMGTDWDSSDKDLFEMTVPTYIDHQPFNTYYMTISAHTPYGFDKNRYAAAHRDQVEDLPYSDLVKGYLASNIELEDAMTYLIGALEAAGIADDTVICITPDHYPYGLADGDDDHYVEELYGYEIKSALDRDHNCWLLWCGELEDRAPIVVDEPTFSLDILPTLLNLFGIDFDSRLLPGRDVFSDAPALVFNSTACWKTSLGYYANEQFVPSVDESEIPEDYVKNITTVVRNKVNYCDSVLDNDYFTYLLWR